MNSFLGLVKAVKGVVFAEFQFPQIHANLGISVLAKTNFREMNSFLGLVKAVKGVVKKNNTRLAKLFA